MYFNFLVDPEKGAMYKQNKNITASKFMFSCLWGTCQVSLISKNKCTKIAKQV